MACVPSRVPFWYDSYDPQVAVTRATQRVHSNSPTGNSLDQGGDTKLLVDSRVVVAKVATRVAIVA